MTSRDALSQLPRATPLPACSIDPFFIPKQNQALISSIGVPPSDWPVFYYTHDAQLFLQPHRTQYVSSCPAAMTPVDCYVLFIAKPERFMCVCVCVA